VDFPGHGLSSHIPAGNEYHVFDFVLTVQRIVEHFGWTRVSLMGHSFGSVIAFLYSAIYPEYVDHYIALDAITPPYNDPVRRLKHQGDHLDDFLHLESMDPNSKPSYTYEEAIQHLHNSINKWATKEGCEILTRRGTIRKPDGRYCFSRDVRLKAKFDVAYSREYVLRFASNLRCKILYIKANEGLSILKPEDQDKLLDTIKKSAVLYEYRTIEGRHHVHLDFPERVAPLISDFLKHQ
jgi:pimeloyl-ACP methyl ester carboxylesterase